MSLGASYDIKQQVKHAIDIADLVGSYLSLSREGRGYKALCPWHADTRPSLQVNIERQSWKCWVCADGGDIFSFVMKIEGVDFPEALAMLADRANISLKPQRSDNQPAPIDKKRLLYQAMAWVDEQYHHCLLHDPCAAVAREYLADRHISDDSIRRFQLGFAPDEWAWIGQRTDGTPFNQGMLEQIGVLCRRRQGPGYYDRFKGRVLFPIFDAQARAVGLGGRVLPQLNPGDAAKYVNSPETPLFSKSHLLYGLNMARDAIRHTKTALVTEGYTDCIAAHQFGFANTVAVLGTALGASHVQLLRRFAERIRVVLVLDGDEAGRRRAKEVLELFVAANVDLRVLTLPDEMDPAEFLLTHGAEAFGRLADNAVDALTHAFQTATADIDLQADLHASTQALEQLVATIAKAPRLREDTLVEDRLREEKFLQRLAVDFRVPEDQVRQLVTDLRRKTAARPTFSQQAPAASVPETIDPLERELLEILLHFPEQIERALTQVQPSAIRSPTCREIYQRSRDCWSAGHLPDFERLLLEFDDLVVKKLLVELDESGRRKVGSELNSRLGDVLLGFERRVQEREMRGRTAALKNQQTSEEDKLDVLLELERQQRARQQQQTERDRLGISDPTEG